MADVKFTASLDSNQVMSSIQQIRSQLGMAFANATGFNSIGSDIAGVPNLGGGGFGHTHTNPAIAFNPHYGAIQAHTTFQQEQDVATYGLGAAQKLKPPGVSSATYAAAAMANSIDRDIQGHSQATRAARSAFYTGVAGMAGGEAASFVGTLAGGAIGAKIGTSLGVGAAAGKLVGGAVLGYMAFGKGMDYLGGKVQEHFAKIEQISGATKELGQLAGGGRGLGRLKQYNLGVAARGAAGDLKMDVNEMGNILALGRQAGMLPTATDPGKARQQYREFAQAIEEGAQVLKTSLAGATRVIKEASKHGLSASEGVSAAAGAGGAGIWLQQQARMRAFVGAGASVGMSMGFTPAQGRSMFSGSLGAVGGLSGAEAKIMGGRFGAAQFVGTTQMAMAAGPMGNMQLMAAAGGGNMAGMGMMDMAGAAMGGLAALGGGDFLTGAGKFMVHQNEYRRGVGAKGIRTMAREQIRMGGDMIAGFMPGLSTNEARRMYAISMGLSPDKAKTLVGGGHGGGGHSDAMAQRIGRQAVAWQDALAARGAGVRHTRADAEALAESRAGGISFSGALTGAMVGGTLGVGAASVPFAVAGAAAGFVADNYHLIGDLFSSGPSVFASAKEKADYYERKDAGEYDSRVKKIRDKLGLVNVNAGMVSRFVNNDMRGARLDFDASGGSASASKSLYSSLRAAGVEETDRGFGTMKVNGHYFYNVDVQNLAKSAGQHLSKSNRKLARTAAYEARFGENAGEHIEEIASKAQEAANLLKGGKGSSAMDLAEAGDVLGNAVLGSIKSLSEGKAKKKLLYAATHGGRLASPIVRQFAKSALGVDTTAAQDAALRAGVAGGSSTEHAVAQSNKDRVAMLADLIDPGAKYDRLKAERDKFVSKKIKEIRLKNVGGVGEHGPSGGLIPDFDIRGDGFFTNQVYRAQSLIEYDVTHAKKAIQMESAGNYAKILADTEGYKEFTTLSEQRNKIIEAKKDTKDIDAKVRDSYKKATRQARTKAVESGLDIKTVKDLEEIDPLKEHYRRVEGFSQKETNDFVSKGRSVSQVAKGIDSLIGTGLSKGVDKFIDTHFQKASLSGAAGSAAQSGTGDESPKKHKKRAGMLQHAAGFGERESAMSTINRTMRNLEKSTAALAKKIGVDLTKHPKAAAEVHAKKPGEN